MKRDVKYHISVSLTPMNPPSHITNAPLALDLDIRDDESTSTTFDVLDGSIPIVVKVPANS